MTTSTNLPKQTDIQQTESQQASVSRRAFVKSTTAVSLAAATGLVAGKDLLATGFTGQPAAPDAHLASRRILVGSGTPDGILSFAWDSATGTLKPEGIAAKISHSTWIALSPDRRYLYVACELEEFQGKPSGAVGSFHNAEGKLTPISLVASEGKGTCHLSPDHTGHAVIAVNYSGGTASSFLSTDGKLTLAWTEAYKGHGPVADRQEMAHAHFASLSPDNKFVYINDLGSDVIHIYTLDTTTAKLKPAGTYHAKPGDGPRTLHFHPGGKVAYCVNELNSTVTVLEWNAADGSLHPIQTVAFLPEGTQIKHGDITNTGCDAVLTRDGKFAYFANRGDDFIIGFHIDPATGKLTMFSGNPRIPSGGKTPRNFTLDPTEKWLLVANQQSSNLTVYARDPKTGVLSSQGKNTPAATPMCIVFV